MSYHNIHNATRALGGCPPPISLAEQKGFLLRVSSSEAMISALLDESALERILTNLASNAIKYDDGKVSVRVEADPHITKIYVFDTGIGISVAFMEHLFEEFKQESEGTSRVYEDMGPGLAITKHLLDFISGLIEVDSVKGWGTNLAVSLPHKLAGSLATLYPGTSGGPAGTIPRPGLSERG